MQNASTKTHLDNNGKKGIGLRVEMPLRLDDNGQLINRAKGKKSPQSNPSRYDSPELEKIRRQHHGLPQNGQLANPTRGKSPLANPSRYDSEELKQTRRKHHSGRK
ncbi:unnamed protein product [Aphanomyces euteiches]